MIVRSRIIIYVVIVCTNTSLLMAIAPYVSPRSTSVNIARELAGWHMYDEYCSDTFYGSVTLTPEYSQSFRPGRLAEAIFGDSLNDEGCNDPFILIQGSLVPDRNPKAWLADYFGLPTDFDGSVFFSPRIQTFLTDIQFYAGFDNLARGLYFYAHAPVVHTRWNLNVKECSTKGTNDYPAGYFNAVPSTGASSFIGAPNSQLLSTALEFFNGSQVPNLGPDATFQRLLCGRWSCNNEHMTKTALSDIEMTLGWNFVCDYDYHVGINVRTSIPTGNKPEATFLFEPIIGSGGHWKLGAGANLHVVVWRDVAEISSISFCLDAYGQHLFDACQRRCFDLCGLANSRYMLAQRLGTQRQTPHLGDDSDAGVEFQGEFAPVANLTESYVNVSVAVEGDVLATFVYARNTMSFEIGYNFWGRTCDRIFASGACNPNSLDNTSWALKGDAQVIGFEMITNDSVNLAATESNATIFSGTNNFTSSTSRVNTNIDNPELATTTLITDVFDLPDGTQTMSSNPPVLLRTSDINFSGTKASTNKIYTHFNYTWNVDRHWNPFLGIGGELEFSDRDFCDNECGSCNDNACDTSCNRPSTSCDILTIDQWGIWLKIGVLFE